ncbi:MAG: hydroxylamine reductase, partial [Spirochaetota bacterium]
MSMFCFQCQETAKNTGCTIRGVCGKQDETANRMDLLIYILRGIGLVVEKGGFKEQDVKDGGMYITKALFSTITNANFDTARINGLIAGALELR